MSFEPKFIEDTGFCEKINDAKKCSLCYWNMDMVCTFSFHTDEERQRINAMLDNAIKKVWADYPLVSVIQ